MSTFTRSSIFAWPLQSSINLHGRRFVAVALGELSDLPMLETGLERVVTFRPLDPNIDAPLCVPAPLLVPRWIEAGVAGEEL